MARKNRTRTTAQPIRRHHRVASRTVLSRPAAFAFIASQAASSRSARVVSMHTAQEIICLVSVAALDRPSAVAVALAVVAGALKAEGRVRSPSR